MRVRRKVKIPKKNLIRVETEKSPSNVSYWMEILRHCADRKNKQVTLVDERVKEDVEKVLQGSVAAAQQAVYDQVMRPFTARHGQYRSVTREMLWPRIEEIRAYFRDTVGDLMTNIGVNWRRWWRGEAPELRYPEFPEMSTVIEWGVLNREIIHVGGRVKILLILDPETEAKRGTRELLSDDSDRSRWRSWNSSGRFEFFLRHQATDEEILLLYNAYPSCLEVRAEFVRRSAGMDVLAINQDLRPSLTWSQIGRVTNAEYRRALMTVGTVRNYPKPLAVDDEGELYPFSPNVLVLKLTCPSTGRVYHLGVPGSVRDRRGNLEPMRTPRQARRWTLGLPEGAEIMAET